MHALPLANDLMADYLRKCEMSCCQCSFVWINPRISHLHEWGSCACCYWCQLTMYKIWLLQISWMRSYLGIFKSSSSWGWDDVLDGNVQELQRFQLLIWITTWFRWLSTSRVSGFDGTDEDFFFNEWRRILAWTNWCFSSQWSFSLQGVMLCSHNLISLHKSLYLTNFFECFSNGLPFDFIEKK